MHTLFSRVSTRPSAAAAALLAALLAATRIAGAHPFCVTGGDAAMLSDALAQASDGGAHAAEDNAIRIAQGTYKTGAATGNQPFFYYSSTNRSLSIMGGFNADCSAFQRKALLTKLDGNQATSVLMVRSGNGFVTISELTLQNGNGDEPGAGLQVNYLVTVNAAVGINDVIIRNNHSSVSAGGLYASAAGGTGSVSYVATSLISGNSADGQYGAGYVTGFSAYNEVYNNTVTQNISTATTNPVGGLYLSCADSTVCVLDNNIFWNNSTDGLFLGSSNAHLSHNDIGTVGGNAPASTEHELSMAPQFADANNDDFHLAANSPLLGYGTPQGPMTDLQDNAFPTAGKIDLGPYAETIFVDGVEGD